LPSLYFSYGSTQSDNSAGTSIETLKSEHLNYESKSKDIKAQILDLQKLQEKMEPQIAHSEKMAKRPG